MNRNCPRCGRKFKEYQNFDAEPICKCDLKDEFRNEKLQDLIEAIHSLTNQVDELGAEVYKLRLGGIDKEF